MIEGILMRLKDNWHILVAFAGFLIVLFIITEVSRRTGKKKDIQEPEKKNKLAA
jgi:hypothetical protein